MNIVNLAKKSYINFQEYDEIKMINLYCNLWQKTQTN